ncbi:MAG: metallophosphoesterase family protein [Lentisphaeraceae bacterium]|nr:metallophosphoesterase family protein [Lentisphaeraceae bacterium]
MSNTSKIWWISLTLMLLSLPLFAVQGDIKSKDIAEADIETIVKLMTPFKGSTPAQWRIIWTGDTARAACVSWSTAEAGKKHVLHYGEVDKKLATEKYQFHQTCQRNGKYTLHKDEDKNPTDVVDKKGEKGKKKKKRKGRKIIKVDPAFYHHAKIQGLKPSTRYYFVIESDGQISKRLYFKTAPASGTDFSIIHGGDSRSGHSARCRMNLRMAAQVEAMPEIIALAHGGDFIVKGGIWSQWRLWLSQNELTTCSDGRVLPIIPTRGNHDGGPIYREVFNIDPKQSDWHTTNLGKDVALVTLDTNVSAGGEQKKWLEKELTRLRPQSKWLITQYHRPLYPAVKKPARHAQFFCPLFDKFNVDLACESDGHCIKRTVPIRNGKADPTGVTYIGEGGLGVGQYKPKPDLWYLKGGKVSRGHHIMLLGFSDEKLRIRTILMDGSTFDDHSLNVREK